MSGLWRVILILLVIALVFLFMRLNRCSEDLAVCDAKLLECLEPITNGVPEPGEVEFTMEVETDSYATFLPVNNQFRIETVPDGEPPPPPSVQDPDTFQSGFFLQVGVFPYSNHMYNQVLLLDSNSAEVSKLGAGFGWLDIVCGDDYPEVLTTRGAARLLEKQIHADMTTSTPVSLVTIWQGPSGISVEMGRDTEVVDHGHDKFVFTSNDDCMIRHWSDLEAATLETSHAPGVVSKVKITQVPGPANHGGVHHPPWY